MDFAEMIGINGKVDLIRSEAEMDWEALKDEFFEALGATLAAERKYRGLDQSQAMESTGLTRGTISDLERGKNRSHGSAYQYALGMGVQWSVIIARTEALVDSRRQTAGKLSVMDEIGAAS